MADGLGTAERHLTWSGLQFELRHVPPEAPVLLVSAPGGESELLEGFDGTAVGDGSVACALTEENARQLRARVPWLRPRVAGELASFGFGDRIGGATGGHLVALAASGMRLHPVIAQQSVRELARSGRTAEAALADAIWGAVAERWCDGFGADADHIQRVEEIEPFAAAGYTMYTLDPHSSVDETADRLAADALPAKLDELPWDALQDDRDALLARYRDPVELDRELLPLNPEAVARAAVKYGRALAHVVELHEALRERLGARAFEVEVSVDESDSPTSPTEHVYIARELHRLGVTFTSLAPRFPGAFEKGVEFVGDLDDLAGALTVHGDLARRLGDYKLSLHSGSDKFAVYPLFAEATRGKFHVKTSGTSYLEALRVVAAVEPALFREIYALARSRYEMDRATYHVSAELSRAPDGSAVADEALSRLLDDTNVRQILHVTFGSVLGVASGEPESHLRRELLAVLARQPELYRNTIERHFEAHLAGLRLARTWNG